MSDPKTLLAKFTKYKAAVEKVASADLADKDKKDIERRIDSVLDAIKLDIQCHDKFIEENNSLMGQEMKLNDIRDSINKQHSDNVKKLDEQRDAQQKKVDEQRKKVDALLAAHRKKVSAFKQKMDQADKDARGGSENLSGTKDKTLKDLGHDFDDVRSYLFGAEASV